MEKNTRFAIHADTSFALRGFFNGKDGVHRKPPSFEMPVANPTLIKLPHSNGSQSMATEPSM